MSSQAEVPIDAEHIDKARWGAEAAEDNGVRTSFLIPDPLNDTQGNLTSPGQYSSGYYSGIRPSRT